MAAPHRVADRLEPLGRLLADFDFADDTRLLGYHRLLGGLSNFHRAFLERILARRQGTVRWVTLHPRMVFTKRTCSSARSSVTVVCARTVPRGTSCLPTTSSSSASGSRCPPAFSPRARDG